MTYRFYSLLTISVIELARPAMPCISEGIIIFVALPSAAFSNASMLLREGIDFSHSQILTVILPFSD